MATLSKNERYKKNPFRSIVIKNTITGTSTIYGSPKKNNDGFAIVSHETGEYNGDVAFGMRVKVDRTHFMKMYANGMRMFLGLSSPGIKVFMLIFDELMTDSNYQADSVVLNYDLLEDDIKKNISQATFYRGINELRKAKFLAPSYISGVYWINTDYVFRGNRLTLVNQYILEDEHEAHETGNSFSNVQKLNSLNDGNEKENIYEEAEPPEY